MSLPVVTTLIILFIVGLIQDALNALYLILVRDNRYIFAALLSATVTILSYGVFAVFVHESLEKSISGLTSFSIGGGLGTFIALRRQGKIKKSES